jgi:hypothetical protein
MACSAVKRTVDTPTPFVDVYDGPIWQQVRKHWPSSHIAVLSAKHGLLRPGEKIEPYDVQMTEQRLLEIIHDEKQLHEFADLVREYGKVIVVGGELYKLFALYFTSILYPELGDRVHFACGTYLQQRGALGTLFNGDNGKAA